MSEAIYQLSVGIDLGTTNSVIAVTTSKFLELTENREGHRINPSYAYYENAELIGRMARAKGGTDPANVFFDSKRLLAETMNSNKVKEFRQFWPFEVSGKEGDIFIEKAFYRTYKADSKEYNLIPPEKVSSDILKSMLEDVCRKFSIPSEKIQAVITVPAYFNMNQKRATIEAARNAGIQVKRLLSEPVAAAIAYQHEMEAENNQIKENQTNQNQSENEKDKLKEGDIVFVFDLGGGTFDVTIMKVGKNSYDVIALGGDSHLGGRDFDNVVSKMIVELLKQKLDPAVVDKKMQQAKYRHRLTEVSQGTKETLSQADEETVILSDIIPEATTGQMLREDFENNSKDLWDKISKCCVDTVRDAKLKPDQINHVILVGGSSKMRKVTTIMNEIFGKDKKLSKALSADEAIAKGAALLSSKLLESGERTFQDALPLSIGIEVTGNRFEVLLEHNTPIPCKKTKVLKTTENRQTEARISIYEGLSEDLEENTFIGTLQISEIPPKKAGEVTLEITMMIDDNCALQSETFAIIEGVPYKVITQIDFQLEYSFGIIKVTEY